MKDPATMTAEECVQWLNANGHHVYSPWNLDAAAEAMPSGWKFSCTSTHWHAFSFRHGAETVKRTDDETTDRFRLAVMCLRAEKEKSNGV